MSKMQIILAALWMTIMLINLLGDVLHIIISGDAATAMTLFQFIISFSV